jgi:hypothetical protein
MILLQHHVSRCRNWNSLGTSAVIVTPMTPMALLVWQTMLYGDLE